MAYFSGKANGEPHTPGANLESLDQTTNAWQRCWPELPISLFQIPPERNFLLAWTWAKEVREVERTGRFLAGRRDPSISLQGFAVHFSEGMFVQQVWFDTAELLTVVDLNSDVVVERTNWRSLVEKYIFCPLKDL